MTAEQLTNDALEYITRQVGRFKPTLALILGSGHQHLSQLIDVKYSLPYRQIPNFYQSSVSGHAGELLFGTIADQPLVCLCGRGHFYEGLTAEQLAMPIILLKRLGVTQLILTNAAGSLRRNIQPGQLVAITDHINFQGRHPLIGMPASELVPRFYPMHDAYSPSLRQRLAATAEELKLELHEGVYAGLLGPNYETAAEIRALQLLGADLVGMSTVPETLVARAVDIDVLAISVISNMATGLSDEQLTHDNVLKVVTAAQTNLSQLIAAYIRQI